MSPGERLPPAPRRRLGGWTYLAVGVVLGVLALAQVPTGSSVVRLPLAVVAVLLIVVGLTRVRATVAGVESIRADESGLALTVADGGLVTVPWDHLTGIELRRVATVWKVESHLLRLRFRGAVRRPEALERYEGDSETGLGQVLIGLTEDQESYLRRHLPDLAGERFATGGRP